MRYKLSRSKVDAFLNCPRCFWLNIRKKIKQPGGFPFTLNGAVDHLLKNEFDAFRGGTSVPPRLAREGLALIPMDHPELAAWRHNFTGIRVYDEPTNLELFGAIDDLWADDDGVCHVVDYKATSKDAEVTLDADWQVAYKRQVEFYQWLLRRKGLKVSERAWFVYANGVKGNGTFEDVLRFRTKIIFYDGNDAWVEPTLADIRRCLDGGSPPSTSGDCDYCKYVEDVAAVVS